MPAIISRRERKFLLRLTRARSGKSACVIFRFRQNQLEVMIFSHKDTRVGLTKAVDALLDITDHKDIAGGIIITAADAIQNRFLNRCGVLIFIDQYMPKTPTQLVSDIVFGAEQFKTSMFQISKIQHIATGLGSGISGSKLALQVKQKMGHAVSYL